MFFQKRIPNYQKYLLKKFVNKKKIVPLQSNSDWVVLRVLSD